MTQLPVFTKKVCTEACEFSLTYYLLSTIKDEKPANPIPTYYGIGIEKRCPDGTKEFEAVYMVSQSSKEVFDIISLLYEGTVTPVTLTDILRDYIKDKDKGLKAERPSA